MAGKQLLINLIEFQRENYWRWLFSCLIFLDKWSAERSSVSWWQKRLVICRNRRLYWEIGLDVETIGLRHNWSALLFNSMIEKVLTPKPKAELIRSRRTCFYENICTMHYSADRCQRGSDSMEWTSERIWTQYYKYHSKVHLLSNRKLFRTLASCYSHKWCDFPSLWNVFYAAMHTCIGWLYSRCFARGLAAYLYSVNRLGPILLLSGPAFLISPIFCFKTSNSVPHPIILGYLLGLKAHVHHRKLLICWRRYLADVLFILFCFHSLRNFLA